MEETGLLVDMRATRGVSEEEDGRAGEDVGIKRGVELRAGGDDGAPRWEDMVVKKTCDCGGRRESCFGDE